MVEDEKDLNLGSIFQVSDSVIRQGAHNDTYCVEDEPQPPDPDPSFDHYRRETGERTGNWSSVEIRLVGSHPLWGHYLYAFRYELGLIDT